MCEAVFITRSGVFKGEYPSLDAVSSAAESHKDLLYYRCFQVYGKKREKKKKLDERD